MPNVTTMNPKVATKKPKEKLHRAPPQSYNAAMITLNDIQLSRGQTSLIEDGNLTIHPGQHIGIIGRNGCGKSSLFKLLLGQLHHDGGELFIPKDWRLSHMAQEVSASDRPVLDYVIDGDKTLRQIEANIASSQARGDDDALGHLYHDLEAIDGYQAKVRAEQLLDGLGFNADDMQRPVSSFSGGWRIRLNLAQALMTPADILLLDEPTNHLDMDATLWLEQWLQRYPGAILLISHDRDFLDAVTQHTLSYEQKQLVLYKGNYSAYERQRAARLALQQAAFEKQQRVKEQMESFVRRFKAKATKAKQAQSRIKALARMEDIAPAHIDSPFHFNIRVADKSSQTLVSLSDAHLGFDAATPILNKVNINILQGSRIGLLGPNGAGKSTLIKSIVGQLKPMKGDRHTGEHSRIGYFAQHQLEALDLNASPLLHIQRLSPEATEQDIRNFLGGFDFHGDDALGSIAHFSGGEKARLALAIVTWQAPALLLLDEPTNHLDLEMRHALTLALQNFPGAVVIVSHDRHLLRNCVDDFLLVAEGKVSTFDGDLDDYHRWLTEFKARREVADKPASAGKNLSADDKRKQKQREADIRKQLSPLKKQLDALEKSVDKLQGQLDDVNEQLADTSLYDDDNKKQLNALLAEQASLSQRLSSEEEAWMEAQENYDTLSAELSN